MEIITLTKQGTPFSPAMAERASAREMVDEVAHMLTDWEQSDELAGEFSLRLIAYFARHVDDLLQVKGKL
jgi:hypothetical protein